MKLQLTIDRLIILVLCIATWQFCSMQAVTDSRGVNNIPPYFKSLPPNHYAVLRQ